MKTIISQAAHLVSPVNSDLARAYSSTLRSIGQKLVLRVYAEFFALEQPKFALNFWYFFFFPTVSPKLRPISASTVNLCLFQAIPPQCALKVTKRIFCKILMSYSLLDTRQPHTVLTCATCGHVKRFNMRKARAPRSDRKQNKTRNKKTKKAKKEITSSEAVAAPAAGATNV
jgi:RNase P subunit RPR2